MSNTININKFAALFEKIPKYPEIWTQEDVLIWLKIIGMEKYYENFVEMGVDGLLILDLEEADIEEELRITTKLHRKKIMKAVAMLKDYTTYLKNNMENGSQNRLISIENNEIEPEKNNIINENQMGWQEMNQNYYPDKQNETKEPLKQPSKENSQKIIIKSIEGPNDMNFTITTQGTQIGRHSTNQIVIFDESVSRYHADIFFQESNFYLRDIGSTTGTFLKINDPITLKEGLILEIGSYQLIVSKIYIHASKESSVVLNESYVEFIIYESPEDVGEKVFKLHSGNSIGRKQNNNVCFHDDLHMSNLHCKINLIGSKFNFEDIASTNGSWLRLSKESQESEPKLLRHGTIFKIGNSAMYEVYDPESEKNKEGNKEEEEQQMGNPGQYNCTICWVAERDCLIIPCKHNASCTRCIKSVKNCPICRTPIHDIIKIYKS